MKTKISILGLLLALNLPAWGGIYGVGTLTPGGGGSPIGAIPDNSVIGFTSFFSVGGLGSSLTDVILTLELQGGFASDLSGYVRLGNQIGSTAYSLTSLGTPLSEGAATTYTINMGSTFFGQNPNNSWTLFLADQSTGGNTHLNGWSLELTAVPEPINVALAVFGVVAVGTGSVRRYLKNRQAASL